MMHEQQLSLLSGLLLEWMYEIAQTAFYFCILILYTAYM